MKIKMRSVLASTFIIAAAAGLGCVWWLTELKKAMDSPIEIGDKPSYLFNIEKGASLREVARRFEQNGWLADSLFLVVHSRLAEHRSIQAGTYRVHTGATPRELFEMFVAGAVATASITFIEGTTFRDFRKVIAKHPDLKPAWRSLADAELLIKLGSEYSSAEGLFYPSTYRFKVGASDATIYRQAYEAMHRHLHSAWQERADNSQLKTPYEALILASIIEKETGSAGERDRIAGVFSRRLERGMKLQTDPTVIYGLGESFDGNLTRKHLRDDTPYNTYTRFGLPPTPIALPSRAAMVAALNPAAGKSLYFVAKGDGSHQFYATLREHNRAV
ncbi:MAG: endolytic transglycosylase MltG, partial [Pseudomonadota bacterium]